jgi:two-component system, OmpR family, alkaline phosphatase synthesis response regulator PhoP
MSTAPPRILVVDDEELLVAGIAENLVAEGYQVEVAGTGAAALRALRAATFDLCVLDVMLPEVDGFEVCATLRRERNEVPVLFLTARGALDDRVRGLEAGGDDYLPKPFALKELLLRVAAILRRRRWYAAPAGASSVLSFAGHEIDLAAYTARTRAGEEHRLTHKEAMILKCLWERAGAVVAREDILDVVWGYEVYPSTRTIDNFIVRLRKRFEDEPERPRHIHTVRGVGYRFTLEPTEDA